MSVQNVLYPGSQGEAVKKLQQQLADLGYDVGEIDAKYGSRTAAAVQKFQQDRGLQVDAQAGPQTMSALYAAQVAQAGPGPGAPPSLSPAQQDVYRQASGLGIPASGVSPGYVAAVGAGKVPEWQAPIIARGIANRAGPQIPPTVGVPYGMEGGRKTWQEHLPDMTKMIGGFQRANPVYMPFPAGTPSGAGSQLLEEARNNAANLALAEQQAAVPKAPGVPTAREVLYGVSTGIMTGLQSALDELAQAQGKTRLSPQEIGAWEASNLKDVLAAAWKEGIAAGLQTSDLEALAIDIENYLNAQAGLELVKSLDFDTMKALTQMWLK